MTESLNIAPTKTTALSSLLTKCCQMSGIFNKSLTTPLQNEIEINKSLTIEDYY